jgi:hypothetical protein
MDRHALKIAAGIVAAKLILAYLLPVTSDEAYYYTWGMHPSLNYYDHPPVTGWVVYLFSRLGASIFFPRLFVIIAGLIAAAGLYYLIDRVFHAPRKAKLVALAFLAAPMHVLFVPITSDAPLFLFVFLAGAVFAAGRHGGNRRLILAAGVLLSLAMLSKYFAGFLLVAMIGVLVLEHRRGGAADAAVLAAGAAPLMLLHLYWNYNDCWLTLMFNVFNRNKEHALHVAGAAEFLAHQIYLATPWVLYYLFKHAGRIRAGASEDRNALGHLGVICMMLLGGLAFFDSSLHWSLSFYPFVYAMLMYVHTRELKRIIGWSLGFSGLHLGAAAAGLVLIHLAVSGATVEAFGVDLTRFVRSHRYYGDIVMGVYGDEIYRRIQPAAQHRVLATPGYPTSSLMAYHSGRHVVVFNDDDRNGRNDDKITDFSRLDGRDFLILSTLAVKPRERRDYTRYFDRFTVDTLSLRGADYTLVRAENFDFRAYRAHHLNTVLNDCYRIPGFLPVGDCFFYKWYFPERLQTP